MPADDPDDEASNITSDRAGEESDSVDTATAETADAADAGGTSREVTVPDRLYKTVTVFSTLFAIVFILGGFVLLDEATERATAPVSEIDPLLAILGLVGIVGGAAVYAFSTRFRAEGMGKSKNMSDESTDNG